MTVKQMIELLSKQNPEALVWLWVSSEDAGSCGGEIAETSIGDFEDSAKARPYVKGDYPDYGVRSQTEAMQYFGKPLGHPIVIIS